MSRKRTLNGTVSNLRTAEVLYYRGNDLRPSSGIVLQNIGRRMVKIMDSSDLPTHERHLDQV